MAILLWHIMNTKGARGRPPKKTKHPVAESTATDIRSKWLRGTSAKMHLAEVPSVLLNQFTIKAREDDCPNKRTKWEGGGGGGEIDGTVLEIALPGCGCCMHISDLDRLQQFPSYQLPSLMLWPRMLLLQKLSLLEAVL